MGVVVGCIFDPVCLLSYCGLGLGGDINNEQIGRLIPEKNTWAATGSRSVVSLIVRCGTSHLVKIATPPPRRNGRS